MKTTDKLTPELRKAEVAIDLYYKCNPLVNLPFAAAAWYLLAFAEDMMWKEHFDVVGEHQASDENMKPKSAVRLKQLTSQDYAMIGDNLVNELEYSMYWLYDACEQGGQVPFTYNGNVYQASWDLFKLGREYKSFVSAYTYGSRGWIGLELQGSTIQPTENLFAGIEYEAYDRLIKPHKSQEALSSVNFDNLPIDAIGRSLKIQGDRFSYKLNPKIVSDTIEALMRPMLDRVFLLPNEWQFSHYSLGDFRKVFEVISAIAYIHLTARNMAALQGCVGIGYTDSIYVPSCNELLRRVVRYSGVSEPKVLSIFDDLSYGNKGITNPDPALQPLIKLNSKVYAVIPFVARNATILPPTARNRTEIGCH